MQSGFKAARGVLQCFKISKSEKQVPLPTFCGLHNKRNQERENCNTRLPGNALGLSVKSRETVNLGIGSSASLYLSFCSFPDFSAP